MVLLMPSKHARKYMNTSMVVGPLHLALCCSTRFREIIAGHLPHSTLTQRVSVDVVASLVPRNLGYWGCEASKISAWI